MNVPIIDPKREELIAQIEHAFRNAERPQITLRVARGMDDNRFEELRQLEKLDAHYTHWTEIPQKDMEAFYDVFLWLCPVGFRFYLPAFMIHLLRHSPRLADEIWISYTFSSDHPTRKDIQILDQAQKAVFLRFLLEVLACVKDDYNVDWWNHPWDEEWEEDAEKELIWSKVGHSVTLLKAELNG